MAETLGMAGMAPSGESDASSASSEARAPGADAALAAADPLAALAARGAAHTDPVRFHFLEALGRRVQAQQGEARRLLETRLAQAIDDYAGRFAQAQDAARAALADAAARHPEAADDLQQLFDAGDFAALRRRIAALAQPAVPTPLAALSASSVRLAPHADSHPTDPADSSDPATPADPAPAAAREPQPVAAGELKSLHYFRDTWAQLSVDRQLAEALTQAPENAGPLNSHRLVLRALEDMREISPDYLKRFLAHADALLWLDQATGAGAPAEKGSATGDGERKRKPDRGGARKGGDEGSRKR
ncbi:MAG TPA: DUF2894 domain-containing protein [Azospira sp.]|nr:DUF2894 domain-containing protein [Azospira sp.]